MLRLVLLRRTLLSFGAMSLLASPWTVSQPFPSTLDTMVGDTVEHTIGHAQPWPKTVKSQRGVYTLTLQPPPSPATTGHQTSKYLIPMRQIHSWRLHIRDAKGEPVSGARIIMEGGMPRHGHGLPSVPKITALASPGDYIIDGMKFSMGGQWRLQFTVRHAYIDRADIVVTLLNY